MNSGREKILYIEDDRVDQMSFERSAKDKNYPFDYIIAGSVKEAEKVLCSNNFDAVIMDYYIGDGTAFDLFDKVDDSPIIIVTGAGDEEIAVKAMKKGAYDYLIKDPACSYLKTLPITVENAVNHKRIKDELRKHEEHLEVLVEERTLELEKLQKVILEVTEKERQRIGQDLHDGIGQNLTAVTFLVQALKNRIPANLKQELVSIDEIENHIKNAIIHTRHLSRLLCPVDFGTNGFIDAIVSMTSSIENVFDVSCNIVENENFIINDNSVAVHLYYIAREAVNNAIKHGKADIIDINLDSNNSFLTMKIQDNGCGKKENESDTGMGLRIMQYRANMIDADFAAGNAKDKGFFVKIKLRKK